MQSQKIKRILISSSLIITLLATTITQTTVSADSNEQIQTTNQTTNQTSNDQNSQSASSNPDNQNQTHTLSNSYVVYGAGASDQQELNSVLSVKNNFVVCKIKLEKIKSHL